MKTRSRIFIALAGAGALGATDFKSATDSIAAQQRELDRALSQFGVGSAAAGAPSGFSGGSAERPGPLFKVHQEMKTQQAAPGKFLFGKLVHKLVVPADGAPAIVELAGGQGSLSGLRIMGTARQGTTGDRVTIEFSRILFKGGRTGSVQAVALDESGGLGVPAYVMSQKALSVTGALASSFVSGVAASQQTLTANPFGFQAVQPTGRNAILQGLAQTAADQSKRLIDEATAIKPVLILEPLTEVSVLVQEEVRF